LKRRYRERLERTESLLAELVCLLDERVERLERIVEHLLHPPIHAFTIQQENSMQSIAPGFSPVFTASPIPAGAVLNPSQPVPTWTSSDTTNAPVTADSTGLVATAAIPASAVVGTSFTLTVNYTNLDGTVATGSASFTIVAPPQQDVTGFSIAQTA
jgi:hypothetical protein